jgi:hypothetical protein
MTNKILNEIVDERQYQITKWGTNSDDRINLPMDWVGYIARESTKWFTGGFRPYDRTSLVKFRQSMVKVAAVAVAAIEATDKILLGTNVRPDILED